jgi:small subunit ribosomal protein S19
MTRSKWKIPYIEYSILKKLQLKKNLNKTIYTNTRSSIILPSFIGETLFVHNGNKFVTIKVQENMVGHKLGEFVYTRTPFSYKKTKK